MSNPNHNVAILIITKNRPDFLIRQLKYYASVKSPHTVYVADASSKEMFEKANKKIGELGERVRINYYHFPEEYSTYRRNIEMLPKIKEKYITFIGDDDFQIPDSLSKCAEFLENNDDFATASGYAVSIRLIDNGTYGDVGRLADYPRKEVLSNKASERLIQFMDNYFVTIFSIMRTDQVRKIYSQIGSISDMSLQGELMPCCLSIIAGKAKIIDCLGFVRQIHKNHYELPDMFDWISDKNFHESWLESQSILVNELVLKDKISLENSTKITKQAFWSYLQQYLAKGYEQRYPNSTKNYFYKNILISVRAGITETFPFLKYIYRVQIKPRFTRKKELHYEVLRTRSPYYNDFKSIMDSFADTE